jgi:hypothetical protein
MWLRKWVAIALILSCAVCASAKQLAWDANTESYLAGYKIHYGPSSGQYTNAVDVGNVTQFEIPTELPRNQNYYFAATAYDTEGLESGYSNEAVYYADQINAPAQATDVRITFEAIGPEPTMAISDNFSSDTSANYTALTGGISISGGAAHGGSAWASNILYHETSLGSAAQDVQADISFVANDSGGVIVRYDTAATPDSFYVALFQTGVIILRKYSGTTPTFVEQYNGSYANGTYTVRVVADGTSIKVYVDGTERISVTDSTYTAGNYCGVLLERGGGNADVTLDNLIAQASGLNPEITISETLSFAEALD